MEKGRKDSSTFRFSIRVLAPDMVLDVTAIDFLELTKVSAQRKEITIYSYDGQSSPLLSIIRRVYVYVNWIDKIRGKCHESLSRIYERLSRSILTLKSIYYIYIYIYKLCVYNKDKNEKS